MSQPQTDPQMQEQVQPQNEPASTASTPSTPRIFQRLDTTARFPYPRSYYVKRAIWAVLYRTVYRWPRGFGVRRAILRAMGAQVADTSIIYSSARLYHPWLFEMG